MLLARLFTILGWRCNGPVKGTVSGFFLSFRAICGTWTFVRVLRNSRTILRTKDFTNNRCTHESGQCHHTLNHPQETIYHSAPITMTNPSFNHFHESSFCAENHMVTVVPSFSYSSPMQLLSSQKQDSVGPFVAGMPVQVPLWMAKVLRQRQLAQINVPDWLSPENLTAILQEEKQSVLLTSTLPFYYFEIARSLQWAMESKSVMILLQDLTNVRVDKIRKHFHELSKGDLQENEGELPMISVTGIASIELNTVGPFLQRAFSDYGYLTQSTSKSLVGGGDSSSSSLDKENLSQEGVTKAATMARSRLRRFRS